MRYGGRQTGCRREIIVAARNAQGIVRAAGVRRWLGGLLAGCCLSILAACGDGTEGDAQDGPDPAVAVAPVPPSRIPDVTPPDPVDPVELPPPAPAAETVPPAAPGNEAAAPPSAAAAPPADPVPAVDPPATPVTPIPPAPVPGAELPPPAEAPVDGALRSRIAAADVDAGAALAAQQCTLCHSVNAGGGAIIGPNLYDIVGAAVGRASGFNYSAPLQTLRSEGAVWTYERLDAFLLDPGLAVPGTRMPFGGIPNESQRAAVIAWLRTLAVEPEPLGEVTGPRLGVMVEGLAPLTFTEQQVADGRDYYTRYCQRCHGDTLGGLVDTQEWGSAPPLAGPEFEARWYSGPVGPLYRLFHDVVRPQDHAGLPEPRYVQTLAYIFSQAGFVPGPVPLPGTPEELDAVGFYQ